jgi:hypothetical protein
MNLEFDLISYLKDDVVHRLYSYDEFMEAVANVDLNAKTFVDVYQKNRPIERVRAGNLFAFAKDSLQQLKNEASDVDNRSMPTKRFYFPESSLNHWIITYGQQRARQETDRILTEKRPKPKLAAKPATQLIDWHWLGNIFSQNGLMVEGDEFDRILHIHTLNIYNIDFCNASFTLSSYQDVSVPAEARLLLLEIGREVSALVIPSYGFNHRFSNTTPVVANYASTELSTFFEMVPDGSSELKLVRPALISGSGKEWDIDTIQKGELRGFVR